jgi:hypothetical protein
MVNGTIDIGAVEVQGGGDSLAPPPRNGAFAIELGGIPLALGWIDAVFPTNHSPRNGRAAQPPVLENAPSPAQRDTLAGSALDSLHGCTRRYALDSLFAAHNDGLDQHVFGACPFEVK